MEACEKRFIDCEMRAESLSRTMKKILLLGNLTSDETFSVVSHFYEQTSFECLRICLFVIMLPEDFGQSSID